MKKLLIRSVIALSTVTAAGNAFAVIPVTDAMNIAQQAQEYVQTATRWTQEVEQYKASMSNQVSQLAAATGVTDIVSLVNQTKDAVGSLSDVEGYLSNPQQILQQGYSALSPSLAATYDSYGLDNLCKRYTDEAQLKNCQGGIVIDVLRQTRNAKELDQVNEHYQNIQDIANKMTTATTTKQAQDYNNAIQVQLALLQADKNAMAIQQNNDVQQASLQQKKNDNAFHEALEAEKSSTNFDSSWGTH
ncbi:TPA: hypothetical protein U5D50_004275 [Yersinia enterocolitica]|nr:hypothetical protein [Yersinia enterocolitica]